MIKKGDIIKIYNRKYSKDDEQKETTTEEYYIVSKVESGTLIVKKVNKLAAGSIVHCVNEIKNYSVYAE